MPGRDCCVQYRFSVTGATTLLFERSGPAATFTGLDPATQVGNSGGCPLQTGMHFQRRASCSRRPAVKQPARLPRCCCASCMQSRPAIPNNCPHATLPLCSTRCMWKA